MIFVLVFFFTCDGGREWEYGMDRMKRVTRTMERLTVDYQATRNGTAKVDGKVRPGVVGGTSSMTVVVVGVVGGVGY